MRMRTERQHVGGFRDPRKRIAAEHFNRDAAGKVRQIELNRLRETGKIYNDKNGFIFVASNKGEYFGVIRKKKFESAA